MGILSNYVRKEESNIYWEKGDLKLFKPTEVELEEINKIITEATQIDIEKGEAVANYGENIIMYIIKNMTSIGAEADGYTYKELTSKFDIDSLLEAITNFMEELTNNIIDNKLKEMKDINSMLKIMEMNLSGEEISNRFNKLLKKQGVNLTIEQMVEYKDNPEKIAELINQSKIKNNKKRKKQSASLAFFFILKGV